EVLNQTENSSTRNHNGEEGSYRKLNKQKGLENQVRLAEVLDEEAYLE
ncbi:43069_t:CDS:2, partial [Gigaspora margarita]